MVTSWQNTEGVIQLYFDRKTKLDVDEKNKKKKIRRRKNKPVDDD